MTLNFPDPPLYRGLTQRFMTALEALAEHQQHGRWWRDVLIHRDLILAVRRESLNVYYRGASLFRITLANSQIVADTHVKYLVRHRQPKLYARLINGVFGVDPDRVVWRSYDGPETLNDLINAAGGLVGPEKAGLHSLILGSPNVIDVEVSLDTLNDDGELPDAEETAAEISESLPPGKQRQPTQDRLDVATLEDRNDPKEAWLVFHEAKHFNNPELRAGSKRTPKIVEQLGRYQGTIGRHSSNVIYGYPHVCHNLVQLHALRRKFREQDGQTENVTSDLSSLIVDVAEGRRKLQVERKPRLVVFGFDKDQRDGAWQSIKDKIEQRGALVYAVGDAAGKTSAAFRPPKSVIATAPPVIKPPPTPPDPVIPLPSGSLSEPALLFLPTESSKSAVYLCNPGAEPLTEVRISGTGITSTIQTTVTIGEGSEMETVLSPLVTTTARREVKTILPSTCSLLDNYDVMSDGDFLICYEVSYIDAAGLKQHRRAIIDKGGPRSKWIPLKISKL